MISSDELATRPDAKLSHRLWERRTNWYRIAEFESAFFCFLAAFWFAFVTDLSDTAVAHRWMLHLATESQWVALLVAVGATILLGAICRPGILRNACLMAGIWFFFGVSIAAIYANAMPVSTCALICHAFALSASFVRRYE